MDALLVTARDTILLLGSVSLLKKAMSNGIMGFYIYYKDTDTFSKKTTGLYDSRFNNFEKEIDLYYFDFIEVICFLNGKNDNYKVIKPFSVKDYNEYKKVLEELSAYQGIVVGLEAELEEVRRQKIEVAIDEEKGVFCSSIEGHGLCSIVIRMRQEGKTDEDIAEFLDTSGCSNAQIGVLLHTDPEASKDARTKLAQRLLGKA